MLVTLCTFALAEQSGLIHTTPNITRSSRINYHGLPYCTFSQLINAQTGQALWCDHCCDVPMSPMTPPGALWDALEREPITYNPTATNARAKRIAALYVWAHTMQDNHVSGAVAVLLAYVGGLASPHRVCFSEIPAPASVHLRWPYHRISL